MARSNAEALVRRVIRDLWNDSATDQIDELYGSRVQIRAPGGDFQGRRGVREFIGMYQEAFPDLSVDVHGFYPDAGDTGGVLHWKFSGTHRGHLMGLAPTGKEVQIEGMTLSRIDDDRIVEETYLWDRLDQLEQLGASPSDLRG